MMSDQREKRRFELIARGLAVSDGRVLICFDRARAFGYLPGGRIEHGEAAAVALRREFLEETGMIVAVGPPLFFGENAFEHPGKSGSGSSTKHSHEMYVVFHVEHVPGEDGEPGWPDPPPTVENHLEFRWVDLAAVVDLDIRPPAIKAWLASGAPEAAEGPRVAWASDLGASRG